MELSLPEVLQDSRGKVTVGWGLALSKSHQEGLYPTGWCWCFVAHNENQSSELEKGDVTPVPGAQTVGKHLNLHPESPKLWCAAIVPKKVQSGVWAT